MKQSLLHQSIQSLNLQIYQHQVSGKKPKFTDKSNKFLYKSYCQKQNQFYNYLLNCNISHQSYLLSKYIPKYFGAFTQSQILHQEDNLASNHQNSNLTQQVLDPVDQIAKQEIQHINTSTERKQWIQHINSRTSYQKNQKFMKLINLTYSYQYPNIMDIKLGIKKDKKASTLRKLKTSTSGSHAFRINGLSVRQFDEENKNGTQRFLSKYYCQKIDSQNLNKHLAFFIFDGNKIHVQLLDRYIESLKQIILGFMSFKDFHFSSSSLYLAYDAYDPKKFTVNFIDFENYKQNCSLHQNIKQDTVEMGLKNYLRHLIQIRNSVKEIQNQLINKQLMYFNEDHDVIPKDKIEEFSQSKISSPQKSNQSEDSPQKFKQFQQY